MNSTRSLLLALLIGGIPHPDALAQGFVSGSTGAFGPLNITTNTTLELPPDGVFHCTTITIQGSRILSFRRNPLNTPVQLLATADVVINGTIDVSGRGGNNFLGGDGGPGGFNGGNPGSTAVPPGAGYGPGAGRGGVQNFSVDGAGPASFATSVNVSSTNKGSVYGNALLIPIIGGSGGGGIAGTPGVGGMGGGGAVLIASTTRIEVNGTVNANSGDVPSVWQKTPEFLWVEFSKMV